MFVPIGPPGLAKSLSKLILMAFCPAFGCFGLLTSREEEDFIFPNMPRVSHVYVVAEAFPFLLGDREPRMHVDELEM